MTIYKETKCKNVLGGAGFFDTCFWPRYSVNPYRGCEHACAYCDAPSLVDQALAFKHKYLMHESPADCSHTIYIKTNASQVLVQELARLKRKGVVDIGLTTDAYQPAEKRYRITRQILQVLRDNNFPFAIGTKSDLILRDLDLISEISQKSWCYLAFTIITLDENLAKLLEPGAPPPQRRLEAMKRFSSEGVTTGVWMSPIIPCITDNDENIENIVKTAVKYGAKFILGGGMLLRENEKVRFMRFLKKRFPELVPEYEKLYGNGKATNESYLLELYKKFIAYCQKYNVETYTPHFYNRKQALLFYARNYGQIHTPLLNYFFGRQLLQTIRVEFAAHKIIRKSINNLHLFPT